VKEQRPMPLVVGETLAEGNVTIRRRKLIWLGNGDNDFDAYSYIAEKLNLTLIETT
jgi:hypothetical protein